MIELSQRTERLLSKLFPDAEFRDSIRFIMANQCADNIPSCKESSPEGMERIRFSVLKLIAEDTNKLDTVFKLAFEDWRDLFMAAGFGHDVDAHEQWYKNIIES